MARAGVATVATLGKVEGVNDFAAHMVDEMHDSWAKTGERGLGYDDGQFSVGWARGGTKYHAMNTDGVHYDQLRVAVVMADSSKGRLANLPLVRDYFQLNGALCNHIEDQASNPSGSQIRRDIMQFVSSPGNNKFLYLDGHGARDGNAVLGNGGEAHINIRDVLAELNTVAFTGNFTFLIETCFSGMWITEAERALGEMDLRRMTAAAVSANRDIHLNFRCSAMAHETSWRNTVSGSHYPSAVVLRLWREERFASAFCGGYVPGWGTKYLLQRKCPADWLHSSAYTRGVHEQQTDEMCDIVYDHTSRKWEISRPAAHRRTV